MNAHPLISVPDVPASSRFYQQILGADSGHGGDEYEQVLVDGTLVLQLHSLDIEHHHGPLGDPSVPLGNGLALWFTTDAFDEAARSGARRRGRDRHRRPRQPQLGLSRDLAARPQRLPGRARRAVRPGWTAPRVELNAGGSSRAPPRRAEAGCLTGLRVPFDSQLRLCYVNVSLMVRWRHHELRAQPALRRQGVGRVRRRHAAAVGTRGRGTGRSRVGGRPRFRGDDPAVGRADLVADRAGARPALLPQAAAPNSATGWR